MLEKKIDKEVLEVFAKLFNRESPDKIIDVLTEVNKPLKRKLERVRSLTEEGESIIDALYKEKLISDELYYYLKSAENNRNIDKFAKEKIVVDRQIKEIVKNLIFSMVSPAMALIVSLGVIYIFIYKVITNFNITEKHLQYLPSYFNFLMLLNKNQAIYFLGIALILVLLILAYSVKRHLPVIGDVFLMYERLKLYIHLYLSIAAGYNLDEALRKYKGGLKQDIEKILSAIEEGEDIQDAIIRTLPKTSPIEKPILAVAIRTTSTESLKDLYSETFDLLKTKLEVLKQITSIVALLVVSSVILFSYGGILMPIIKAIKSVMM